MYPHLKTLGVALLLLHASCSLHEELYLNRDGSGRYIFKMDLANLVDNPQFAQLIGGPMGVGLPNFEQDTSMVLHLPNGEDGDYPIGLNVDSLLEEEVRMVADTLPLAAEEALPGEATDSIDIVTLGAENSSYAPGEDSLDLSADTLTEEDLAMIEETYGKQGGQNPFSGLLKENFLKQLRAEATVYLSGLPLKDSSKRYLADDPFYQSLFLHIEVDLRENAPRKLLTMGLGFDFDHPQKINEWPQMLENLSDLGQNLPMGIPSGVGLPNLSQALSGYGTYQFNGRSLSRETSPSRPEFSELMDQFYAESQADPEMAGLEFGSPSYRLTLHLPGKITRNTFNNSAVEGNTLEIQLPLQDFMRGKYPITGKVKFR